MTQLLYKDKEESPALINFIESLPSSEYTRKSYRERLDKFMKFLKVNDPQELLKWDQKVIQERIISFIISCRNAGRSQWSIHAYYTSLKHFYEINDIPLNWKKIKMFAGKVAKKANDRPYTFQEIHKLLEHATPRQKVVILLQCSAGLRAGAIPYLKVGHLHFIQEHGIYQIKVYAGTRDEYITFCTFECATAIDSYIEYRKNRLGETITEESPLVVNLIDKEYNYNGRNVGEVTSSEGIKRIVYRLLYDSGIRRLENRKAAAGGRYMTATCHSLRKFFGTQLEHAKVRDLAIENLLGHSTGLRGVYRKIPDDELLEAYLVGMPHLIINNEERWKKKAKEEIAARERDQTQWHKEMEEMSYVF
jgi:integrase